MRAANLRRWLKRPNCPEVIRHFKYLFDKVFSPETVDTTSNPRMGPNPREIANYKHNGIHYSRSSTHLGNSLILYYPSISSVVPVAGSIEKITVSTSGIKMFVRRQVPLPPGQYDPFRRYPSFPAALYSAQMDEGAEDKISLDSIVSHVARFTFLKYAIIVNLSRVSLRNNNISIYSNIQQV